jgi:hypothetical protein
MFERMGFDAELRDLEARRDRGPALPELAASAPDEMLRPRANPSVQTEARMPVRTVRDPMGCGSILAPPP